MKLTDEQLLKLIEAGLTDEQIMQFAHENTPPADLYGATAQVVTDILHGDPIMLETLRQNKDETGAKEALALLERIAGEAEFEEVAEWWRGLGIGRADTKKICMTMLYGSKEFGNRDSIQERIDKRAEEILEKALDPYFDRSGADIWKDYRTKAITVMVRLTRSAVAIVCPSTVETMDTIQGWAGSMGARDLPFKFRTKLGFMVIQDNPNQITKQIEIWENGKRVGTLAYREKVKEGKLMNERKMAAGAAPNFVHSNDACHLMMATNATAQEITNEWEGGCEGFMDDGNGGKAYFMMIHDSMATQCADTPALARQIRQTACEIYADSDLLFDVWGLNGGEDSMLAEPEPMGDLDVTEVLNSRYFFS
ncbi:DNA-directed RNA polymerase [Aeromonas phage vB_AsaP_MQM1]|nr:DNA-directed RNA polymerase [Aeromonas phage vB_AsaP_MQM1]